MRSHHIALIGANSRIGPAILHALLEHVAAPKVFVLIRSSSQPIPPHPRLKTVVIPSDPPLESDLVSALREHEIESLVCALNPSLRETQITLANACVLAGVGRFMPADYGSMRSDDEYVLNLLPNFRNKQLVRDHCERIAAKHTNFTWTSFATGHFFDYGLETELLGIDIKKGEALLFDGGKDMWSASTTRQIGQAVANILLEKEDETANKMLLIQSFCISQLQVLNAIRAVGRRIEGKDTQSEEYIKEKAEEAKKGDAEAVEELVAVLGIKRSNWTGDALFANQLLGLEEEDLQTVVKEVLRR